MNKKAQEILNSEIKYLVNTSNIKIFNNSLFKLSELATILDSMGATADADHVDRIIKEASSIWDFLLGGGAGAATTKDDSGKSIIDAFKDGNIENFFSKKTIETMLTKFLLGGGIGLLAGELVEVLTREIPILKWFGNSTFIKVALEGALSYAVMNSDFVSKLVDGIVKEMDKVVSGLKMPTSIPQPQATNTTNLPGAK